MKDHPIKGIIMMAIAVFLIITMNMFAKMVGNTHTPVEIVFWRNFVALIIVLALMLKTRDISLFKTQRIKEHMVRSIGGTCGLIMVFWAYALMPMADVVAIMFTAGLMTTGLSAFILKEKVGVYRWGAVAFGFLGAFLTVLPSGNEWELKGVIVSLSAAFVGGALVSTMLRSLGKTEPALTTVFYFLTVGIIITLPYVLYAGHFPSYATLWPLIGCGVAGGISLIFKTEAFRYAEASLLSPVHYTSIIWATFMGWVAFGDLPTFNVLAGASIIILANLVIVWREHIKSKAEILK
jgi:drug/metabolite transporter (DMT)-like permease